MKYSDISVNVAGIFSGKENKQFSENAYYKACISIIINMIKCHVDLVMTVVLK